MQTACDRLRLAHSYLRRFPACALAASRLRAVRWRAKKCRTIQFDITQSDRDFASSIDFQRFSLTPELHLTPDGALPVCLMLATAADIDSDAHRGLLFAMVWCTRHAAAVVESLCELLPCPSAFCSHKSLLFERDSKVKASILISCLVSSLHKACVSFRSCGWQRYVGLGADGSIKKATVWRHIVQKVDLQSSGQRDTV